jgi:hypothetical protein
MARSSTLATARKPLAALAGLTLAVVATGLLEAEASDEVGLVRTFEGTLYEPGSKRQTVLYRWELWMSEDEQRRRTRFVTDKGRLAVTQKLELERGEFKKYTVIQHEADQRGVIRRTGDRIEFSYTKNGKTKTNSEDYVPNFVAGPMLVTYLQSRWEALLAGEEIKLRVGVANRTESIGFEIRKEAETRRNGEDVVVLKMKPRSFVISALVDPITFTFSRDGKTVYEVVGRSIPLRKVGRRWKPSHVEGVYSPVGPEHPAAESPPP